MVESKLHHLLSRGHVENVLKNANIAGAVHIGLAPSAARKKWAGKV
jgi:hypothetical protein